MSELLDRLELTGFDRASCTADDAIIDPDDVREFRLVLRYRKAGRKVFSGYYDRDGLPLGWADFAGTLLSFLSSYGDAESLSPDTYTRRRRRQGDLMFLSVVFGEKGQEYCYLSPDETIEVGDWVHVPVGEENHVATAKVAAVIWLPKEEAPIPFEMIKTAIGKADD